MPVYCRVLLHVTKLQEYFSSSLHFSVSKVLIQKNNSLCHQVGGIQSQATKAES